MTPTQVRMARAALDRSAAQLASDAAVAPDAVKALETGSGSPDVAAKLRTTFEAAGIEFLGEDGIRFHPLPVAGTIPTDKLNSANDE